MPVVSEFRHRILMQRAASPFVISNAVRGTWLGAGTPPSGGPDRRIRATCWRVGGFRALAQIIRFCASGSAGERLCFGVKARAVSRRCGYVLLPSLVRSRCRGLVIACCACRVDPGSDGRRRRIGGGGW
jgi:hypothetical protein